MWGVLRLGSMDGPLETANLQTFSPYRRSGRRGLSMAQRWKSPPTQLPRWTPAVTARQRAACIERGGEALEFSETSAPSLHRERGGGLICYGYGARETNVLCLSLMCRGGECW